MPVDQRGEWVVGVRREWAGEEERLRASGCARLLKRSLRVEQRADSPSGVDRTNEANGRGEAGTRSAGLDFATECPPHLLHTGRSHRPHAVHARWTHRLLCGAAFSRSRTIRASPGHRGAAHSPSILVGPQGMRRLRADPAVRSILFLSLLEPSDRVSRAQTRCRGPDAILTGQEEPTAH